MRDLHAIVSWLRKFRSIHRYIGITVGIFLVIVSTTGIFLGWKKDVEWLQPITNQGVSTDLRGWKSFEAISIAAVDAVDSIPISKVIDRLDVRPDKGIIKVLFKEGYWEVQVDGKSGKVLSVAKRHADWIEHLHDGSLISDAFKLGYTNIVGFGLLTLAVTGLWLWYGPKVIRKSKEKR